LERKESELDRALELEEFMRFAESLCAKGLNSATTVMRVVVYENPRLITLATSRTREAEN
jgi:hypothetical protein